MLAMRRGAIASKKATVLLTCFMGSGSYLPVCWAALLVDAPSSASGSLGLAASALIDPILENIGSISLARRKRPLAALLPKAASNHDWIDFVPLPPFLSLPVVWM